MCLYPKLIKNRKYTVTKKNGGEVPENTDPRTLYVPVGCGKCMECLRQRARQWAVRLTEEIKQHERGKKHFVTLTFSNESIREITKEIKGLQGYELENEIATKAVRRFLERWRWEYGKSVKHWLVTELGPNGTENIHLHGIIFTDQPQEIARIWNYGYVWLGTYVNEATVNYVIKYCTKQDIKHPNYKSKILTSPGIGNNYISSHNAKQNQYQPNKTNELYKTRQGSKVNLPIYYRNHLYTDQQKESLWIEKLDKQERWVDGVNISIKNGTDEYYQVLQQAREKNRRLGYGDDSYNWEQIRYENQQRQMNMEKRQAIKDLRTERDEPQKTTRPNNKSDSNANSDNPYKGMRNNT